MVLALALTPATVVAQTLLRDEILRAEIVAEGSRSDSGSGPVPVSNGASPEPAPVVLPEAPASQRGKASRDRVVVDSVVDRVVDKKFIAVMAALGGSETLRFTTHKLVLDNEFAAGAPWVTSVPANKHLVAEYSGIFAAELLVAYELKKPHSWLPGDKYIRKFWWAYPAVMIPIHIKNGVRSIRTQPPSCPVEECGPQ